MCVYLLKGLWCISFSQLTLFLKTGVLVYFIKFWFLINKSGNSLCSLVTHEPIFFASVSQFPEDLARK